MATLTLKSSFVLLLTVWITGIVTLWILKLSASTSLSARTQSTTCALEIRRYQRRLLELDDQLYKLQRKVARLLKRNEGLTQKLTGCHPCEPYLQQKLTTCNQSESYLKNQLLDAEVLTGRRYRSELDISVFKVFTLDPPIVHTSQTVFSDRVSHTPRGNHSEDLHEIVKDALDLLQTATPHEKLHFVQGLYRVLPRHGAHYQLAFERENDNQGDVTMATMFRPFAPTVLAKVETVNVGKPQVHIVLPLSGRLKQFDIFINHFRELHAAENVLLTIVYFGSVGMTHVKNKLHNLGLEPPKVNIINLNQTFSRAKGLQTGALSWNGDDVVTFFTDVDVLFSENFIRKCKLYTQPNRYVYFPIVFSHYNPKYLRNLPKFLDSIENCGYWRTYGFGMSCQYLSDFKKVTGFENDVKGWGEEDILLHGRYLASDVMVIRAFDVEIEHIWHRKECDALSRDAKKHGSCQKVRATNEGSNRVLAINIMNGNV